MTCSCVPAAVVRAEVGDLGYDAPKIAFGICIDLNRRRVAQRYIHDLVLVYLDFDLHMVEAGYPHHYGTGHLAGSDDAFAKFHQECADRARHGTVDGRFANLLFGFAQARIRAFDRIFGSLESGFGHVVPCFRLFEHALGDRGAFKQIPLALAFRFGLQ